MDKTTLESNLVNLLTEIAPEATDTALDYGESLQDQLDLDSVDMMNFIAKVEEKYDSRIPSGEYKAFLTIASGAEYLARRI